MVLADPEGSIVAHYIETGEISEDVGSWMVEGIGEDFLPPVSDLSSVKQAFRVSDQEAFNMARQLLLEEGLLGWLFVGYADCCSAQVCPRPERTQKHCQFCL